jgi:hypothetical protein
MMATFAQDRVRSTDLYAVWKSGYVPSPNADQPQDPCTIM